LAVVDYYSNYPEVIHLNSITSANVIEKLKDLFTIHGIPNTLVTDNGP